MSDEKNVRQLRPRVWKQLFSDLHYSLHQGCFPLSREPVSATPSSLLCLFLVEEFCLKQNVARAEKSPFGPKNKISDFEECRILQLDWI